MQLGDYFDFLSEDDIRVKGTRIGIETILYEYLHGGRSPEAIAARYPSLRLEQVHATITYYLHNGESIRAYLTRWLEHGRRMREEQQQNPSAAVRRLRELKAQRQGVRSPVPSRAVCES